jgi:hypothetical protein
MWKKIVLALILLVALGGASITWWVEHEGAYASDQLYSGPADKALILYHPSRDAHFADDLTRAIAAGLFRANFAVERRTLTGKTDPHPRGFAVIAIVSNTFYASPDWPTMRYLARADLAGTPTIAVIGGSGNTDRAQRKLDHAIRLAGGRLLGSRAYWLARPNAPGQAGQSNRAVARKLAREFALGIGWQIKRGTAIAAPARSGAPTTLLSPLDPKDGSG